MFVSLGFYNTQTFCYQNLGIVNIFCAIIVSVHARKKKKRMVTKELYLFIYSLSGVRGEFKRRKWELPLISWNEDQSVKYWGVYAGSC